MNELKTDNETFSDNRQPTTDNLQLTTNNSQPITNASRLFIIGFTGAGKTTYGRKLAAEKQVPFYDLDEEIEKNASSSIAEIFAEKGENNFRELERKTLQTFPFPENAVIACGGGTPCFYNNLAWMKQNGKVIYLQKSPEQILQQLSQTAIEKRPLLQNKSPEQITEWIRETLAKREVFYWQADEIAV